MDREDAAAWEGLYNAQVDVQAGPVHPGYPVFTGKVAGELEGRAHGHSYLRPRGIHLEGLAWGEIESKLC